MPAGRRLTIAPTIANSTAAAMPPIIVAAGTHKTINVNSWPGPPVLPVAQKDDMHEAVVNAPIVPKSAPHPNDLPIVLPMLISSGRSGALATLAKALLGAGTRTPGAEPSARVRPSGRCRLGIANGRGERIPADARSA